MLNKQLISAENIKMSFGDQEVLDFERFQLYEGERIGLVGANGAGKSTLIKILSGVLEPDKGQVKINCDPFYFQQFQQDWDSFVLISHDRSLMNEVCNQIVEISFGKLKRYPGNYDSYLELKEAEINRQWSEYEQYQNEKKRLQRVYMEKKVKAQRIESKPHNMSVSDAKTRNFIGNRKVEDKARNMEKSATNIMKRMEHMEVKNKPKETPKIRPDFRLTNPPKNPIVIRGEGFTFGYDSDNLIYNDASIIIKNKSKVAILGDNGAGKSTLLNMIISRNQISVVPGARIGYVSQNLSELDNSKTVLENMREHWFLYPMIWNLLIMWPPK